MRFSRACETGDRIVGWKNCSSNLEDVHFIRIYSGNCETSRL